MPLPKSSRHEMPRHASLLFERQYRRPPHEFRPFAAAMPTMSFM